MNYKFQDILFIMDSTEHDVDASPHNISKHLVSIPEDGEQTVHIVPGFLVERPSLHAGP
jgi:hypothetical protein